VAQKRREYARLWPLRRLALLQSGTLPHSCQPVFATPLAKGSFRHAGIAAGGEDIVLKVLENFEDECFVIGRVASGHEQVSSHQFLVKRRKAQHVESFMWKISP
jgi:hypothetical protein